MKELTLQILPWIFFLLLFILCLVIVLLLVVLFVPIRYHIHGEVKEKIPNVKGRARWLLGIGKVDFSYDESFLLQVKVLGKSLYQYPKTNKENLDKEKTKEDGPKDCPKPSNPVFPLQEKPRDKDKDVPLEIVSAEEIFTEDVLKESQRGDHSPFEHRKKGRKKKRKEKKTLQQRIEEISQGVYKNLGKVQNVKEKIKYYLELLQRPELKITLQRAQSKLGKILAALLPKKWQITGVFGMEDPSLTGQITGILAFIYPYTRNHVKLYPDFEKETVQADFFFRGKLRTVTLLYQCISFLLNKDCMQAMKLLFKKENKKKKKKQEA